MYQLNFQKKAEFKSLETGITIKAILRLGNLEIATRAKVDTGSDICIFKREIGEYLEIDIETGFEKKLITLAGGLTAYGHYVELETLGLRFDSLVYFAADYALNRNLLGRQGWLQLIKFGLDDYRSEIYISPNDEEI
jgi:hypothetical protein